jgi:hypothetical protein
MVAMHKPFFVLVQEYAQLAVKCLFLAYIHHQIKPFENFGEVLAWHGEMLCCFAFGLYL